MNVRFSDEAVRIRLSADEVERLRQHDDVSSAVHFPNGTRWSCTLDVTVQPAPTVTYAAGRLAIELPVQELDRWRDLDEDDVAARSVRYVVPAGTHRLTLIIEQDLHSTPERS
jgi:hypothetical protein